MAKKRIVFRHIYNTGVNLAWAQVFTQHRHSANEIRKVLEQARGHARAAGIFESPDNEITLAIQRLNQFGVGQQALDAIEAALFHLQGQLRELGCSTSD